MNFLISDTFTKKLARSTGDEWKSVKTTASDQKMRPGGGGPMTIAMLMKNTLQAAKQLYP